MKFIANMGNMGVIIWTWYIFQLNVYSNSLWYNVTDAEGYG